MRGPIDIRISNGDVLGALKDFAKQVMAWAVQRPRMVVTRETLDPAPCPSIAVVATTAATSVVLPNPATYPGETVVVISRAGATVTVSSVTWINNASPGTVTVTTASTFTSDGVYWWQV